MQTPNDDDAANNRMIGEIMFDHLTELMRVVLDSGLQLARWVLTSLMAINGGAAIATWGAQMEPRFKIIACALFVLGLLLALSSAHATTLSLKERVKPIGEAIGYWARIKHDGGPITEHERLVAEMLAANKAGEKWSKPLGYASALAFVVGIIITGTGGIIEQANAEKLQAPATIRHSVVPAVP